MRIVVLDGYPVNPGDNEWTPLVNLGKLEVFERSDPEQVILRAAGAEILVINKIRLTREHFEMLPELRMVAVTATGYDVVDVAAATDHEIAVCNVPEYGTMSVAQHVFALLFALTNRVARHDELVRAGKWAERGDFCFWESAPQEMAGRVLGIVGWGRIGRQVGRIGSALGMKLLVTSRTRPAAQGRALAPWDEPASYEWVLMDELFSRSDVVTLHCPLTADTKGMIHAGRLEQMRSHSHLINTARGGLVNEVDLAAALQAGAIGGAAVDVASTEPMEADNPLLGAPRLLITPHMAWGSLSARRRLVEITAANVSAFLAGVPQNVVV